MYIADAFNTRVMKYTNITSASQSPPIVGQVVVSADYGCGLGQLSLALYVAVDSLGNIFVSDYICNQVTKWTAQAPGGTVVAGIGNGTGGSGANGLLNPMGIDVDQNGALHIVDSGNGRIQKWPNGSSTGITVAGDNGLLCNPLDVKVDSYGAIYVLAWDQGVFKFNPGSTWGTLVISDIVTSFGFKFDSFGNAYLADRGSSEVRKYTVNSTVCGACISPDEESNSFTLNVSFFVSLIGNVKAIVAQLSSKMAATADFSKTSSILNDSR